LKDRFFFSNYKAKNGVAGMLFVRYFLKSLRGEIPDNSGTPRGT
jgi:hypothetical protein